ncbi:MAG: hypothetical protein ACM3NR_02075, partial [Methanosarcina sp.]
VSCFANVLGLNISSAFNSAVTIYILIPLLIIPQMALGGAMFDFDKINSRFGGGNGKSPIVADVMASRWAYEGLAVTQFKNNRYEKDFFDIEKIASQSNFKQAFYIPELRKIIDNTVLLPGNDSKEMLMRENLRLLLNEFNSEMKVWKEIKYNTGNLTPEKFDNEVAKEAHEFLDQIEERYIKVYNLASSRKDELITKMQQQSSAGQDYLTRYDAYYNDFLSDILKKTNLSDRIVREEDRLVQTAEPIYKSPDPSATVSLRAHFFAPEKYFFGIRISTLFFNLIIIWLMSVLSGIALYFDVLRNIVEPRKGRPKAASL